MGQKKKDIQIIIDVPLSLVVQGICLTNDFEARDRFGPGIE